MINESWMNIIGSICMLLLVLCFSVFLFYKIYKVYYERKINKVILDGERIQITSIREAVINFSVCALLVFTIGSLYILATEIPKQHDDEMKQNEECDIASGTVAIGYTDDIKNEIDDFSKLTNTKDSMTTHKERINNHMEIQYFLKNNKDYYYLVSYELNREIQDEEQFYVQVAVNGGTASSIIPTETLKKKENIVVVYKGSIISNCDAQNVEVTIRNFTAGKNKHVINEIHNFTVDTGGITIHEK